MYYRDTIIARFFARLTILICLVSLCSFIVCAQSDSVQQQKQKAMQLINEGHYLDALPILEKIILFYPNDAELWANYGVAIMTNSSTITNAEARNLEIQRGIKVLENAKRLGTTNIRALHFLDEFADADDDNFSHSNPEVEKALREGEAFFGRGQYEEAFKSYEKAHKLDPENYEAVLFMGDCFYAQRKYSEAEPYFAKAVLIAPDNEMAYRFWGDALLNQKKYEPSLDKFLDALIIEPFSRLSWDSLRRWAKSSDADFSVIGIAPPGNDISGNIEIKEELLLAENGTSFWKLYSSTVKTQMAERAKLNQRYSLGDEVKAFKKVADAVRREIKGGTLKNPDQNLINLVTIDDRNLLEAYLLLVRPLPTFGEDYAVYEKTNRNNLKQFVREFVLNLER